MVKDAGQRDRYVTIQQLTASVGESGFPVETWSDLRQVYTSRVDESRVMNEHYTAHQLSVPVDTRWQIPYFEDMDPELFEIPRARRLLYQSRIYDITLATPVGRKQSIELTTLAKQG